MAVMSQGPAISGHFTSSGHSAWPCMPGMHCWSWRYGSSFYTLSCGPESLGVGCDPSVASSPPICPLCVFPPRGTTFVGGQSQCPFITSSDPPLEYLEIAQCIDLQKWSTLTSGDAFTCETQLGRMDAENVLGRPSIIHSTLSPVSSTSTAQPFHQMANSARRIR